jgi:hypothetical protein
MAPLNIFYDIVTYILRMVTLSSAQSLILGFEYDESNA